MRKCAFYWVVLVILSFQAGMLTSAHADVVGRLTQVEGRVDLLKAGKLPVVHVKVNDPVEIGDVLRTKSLSRAQIKFMDNTIITISPESRLAVENYLFDPAKSKRNVVLKLFRGLAHLVVSKVFKMEQPDFVVETHTAVLGVRGTDFGIRLHPNSSTFLNFQGVTRVTNLFPEVAGSVELHDMQGTTVVRGLPPTLPFAVSAEDRKLFMGQLSSGLTSRKGKGSGIDAGMGTLGTAATAATGTSTPVAGTAPTVSSEATPTVPTAGAVTTSTPTVSDPAPLSLTTYAFDTPLTSTETTPTNGAISSTTATNLVGSSVITSTGTGLGSTSILVNNLPTIPPTPAQSLPPPPPPPTPSLPPHPPR